MNNCVPRGLQLTETGCSGMAACFQELTILASCSNIIETNGKERQVGKRTYRLMMLHSRCTQTDQRAPQTDGKIS